MRTGGKRATTLCKRINGQNVTKTPAGKIAAAATRVCLESGLGAVTMRAVAAAAGVAPSGVVYHFATREKLLLAVLEQLEQQVGASCAALRQGLDETCLALADPASIVAAMLCTLISEQGLAIVTIGEVGRALATCEEAGAARAIMERFHRGFQTFWANLPHVRDTDEVARDIWAAAAVGTVPLVMLDRNPVSRNVEIVRLMHRLACRLDGKAAVLIEDDGDASLPEADVVECERARGKAAIVRATIRLSGMLGVDGLTHRKIAAEAGLSIASTTYFYPTKQDIVIDAARELQAHAINAVVQAAAAPTEDCPLQNDPRSEILSRIMLDDDGELRADLAALTAFACAAVRLTELDGLALTLRKVRGTAAVHWLRSLGLGPVDRVDGLIWAMSTVPLSQHALFLPPEQRAAYLDATSRLWLDRLFH